VHLSSRRYQQFRSALRGPALGLLGAACLAACGGQVSVKSSWQDHAARNQPYTRILVIAVTPDYTQRCRFEYWMAKDLQSDKVVADSSCNSMPKDVQLTRDNVVRVVAALHSDAVLATSLVEGSFRMQEGGSAETRGGGNYEAIGYGYGTGYYYGLYSVPVTYATFETAPPLTEMKGTVHIVTRLYDVRSASLIYSIDTKARDLESTSLGLAAITPAIADRLRHDGLIQ
jgi:hypothetical protein